MYRIAVCEDEPNRCAELCKQCREILTELDTEHEVVPFFSAEELETALTNGEHFDLLCLDIFLAERTGMELAREVRKWDDQVSILFITSSTEFLLKPVKQAELKKALQTDLRLNCQSRAITLKVRDRTAVLYLSDIRYVESRNHACIFHLTRENQTFVLSLAQAEQLLPRSQFCRCHNSFLVNLACISAITGGKVILTDGTRLPIGRRYAEQFQEEFVQYINNSYSQ